MQLNLSSSRSKFVFGSLSRALTISVITLHLIQIQMVKTTRVYAQPINTQPQLNSVPTIDWHDRLSSFEQSELNTNQVYSFNCPAAPDQSITTPVWGTNLYTIHSGLCQAATHQGMISKDGGLINLRLLPSQTNYLGSDRFGISSRDYSRSSKGFQFIGEPIVFESEFPDKEDSAQNKRKQPSPIERTVENGVRRGIERTISDSIRDIFR